MPGNSFSLFLFFNQSIATSLPVHSYITSLPCPLHHRLIHSEPHPFRPRFLSASIASDHGHSLFLVLLRHKHNIISPTLTLPLSLLRSPAPEPFPHSSSPLLTLPPSSHMVDNKRLRVSKVNAEQCPSRSPLRPPKCILKHRQQQPSQGPCGIDTTAPTHTPLRLSFSPSLFFHFALFVRHRINVCPVGV